MEARTCTSYGIHAAAGRRLVFRPIEPDDFALLAHFMELTDSRTCDYTLGGVVLWTDLFGYRIATAGDSLFIAGGREDNPRVRAFSLPLGAGSFGESVQCLRDYCRRRGLPLWFSAIPEDRLHLFASVGTVAEVCELGDSWSDYLYDLEPFVSLSGNKMKRKRNHVNRFMADNPGYATERITPANAAECLALLGALGHDGSATGAAEYAAVGRMLAAWRDYAPYFHSMLLRAGGRVVGFTVGEVKHDTLHVHVEKADHGGVDGSGETLAHLFASEMARLFPRLRYINRQDDAGDPGLRAAKQSWHPRLLLPKFNVRVS